MNKWSGNDNHDKFCEITDDINKKIILTSVVVYKTKTFVFL